MSSSLKRIETILDFTMETWLDEGFDGWVPTLDTQLRINKSNAVEYKYFEKSTSNKRWI